MCIPMAGPASVPIADLDAATVEDVKAFHAAYYRPDNAVLVVAGNFDQKQFDAWVDKYFGPLQFAQARDSACHRRGAGAHAAEVTDRLSCPMCRCRR